MTQEEIKVERIIRLMQGMKKEKDMNLFYNLSKMNTESIEKLIMILAAKENTKITEGDTWQIQKWTNQEIEELKEYNKKCKTIHT